MSSKPVLKLDWCSHKAARYAVERWHYSRTMPVGKLVKIGVWEDSRFIGSVLFTHGTNQFHGVRFGLGVMDCCELVRVALDAHRTPVTKIVSIAMRMLKSQSPGMRFVVSCADPAQGHIGGIYQGGNWFYVGLGGSSEAFIDDAGKRIHSRVVGSSGAPKIHFGRAFRAHAVGDIHRVRVPQKYKYFYPLDEEMRAQIAPLAKPYPKRPRAESIVADAPVDQTGEDGSQPISALHTGTPAVLAHDRAMAAD